MMRGALQRALASRGHWACCSAPSVPLPACASEEGCSAAAQEADLQLRRVSGSAASSSKAGGKDAEGGPGVYKRRRQRSPDAYKARLPPGHGRYAVLLRERDPAAFDRMRLLLGFYDLPENAHLTKPAPPESITLSNLQTLRHLDDIDPYYRLALLSYRSRALNEQVTAALGQARAFLASGSADPLSEFVPATPLPAEVAGNPSGQPAAEPSAEQGHDGDSSAGEGSAGGSGGSPRE